MPNTVSFWKPCDRAFPIETKKPLVFPSVPWQARSLWFLQSNANSRLSSTSKNPIRQPQWELKILLSCKVDADEDENQGREKKFRGEQERIHFMNTYSRNKGIFCCALCHIVLRRFSSTIAPNGWYRLTLPLTKLLNTCFRTPSNNNSSRPRQRVYWSAFHLQFVSVDSVIHISAIFSL